MRLGFRQPCFGRDLFNGLPTASQAGPFERALEVRRRTRSVNFDSGYGWSRPDGMFRHLGREVRELREAVRHESPARQQDELGDVLLITTQLGAALGLDPEAALHQASDKFIRRYQTMETIAQERWGNPDFNTRPKAEKKQLWQAAKAQLQASGITEFF